MANTACERLIEAGCALHKQGLPTFRRVDLRDWIMDKYPGVTKQQWKDTYNPCIQGMDEGTSARTSSTRWVEVPRHIRVE